MNRTSIEWCTHTVNPIRFRNKETGKIGHYCEKISPGCKNCYASRMQKPRLSGLEFRVENRDKGELFFDEGVLAQVLRRRKFTVIFWSDMTDLFGPWVPDEWIDRCAAVVALTPHLRHLWLTKRARRMREWFTQEESPYFYPCTRVDRLAQQMIYDSNLLTQDDFECDWPLPNLGLGVSVEDRKHLDRIDDLRETPAAMRFVSFEPLLEYLGTLNLAGISWVIVGGESGPGARPMHPDSVRSIRDQCVAAQVLFFFKQWGGFCPVGSVDGCIDECDCEAIFTANINRTVMVYRDGHVESGDLPPTERGAWFMEAVPKKAAGRLLDGQVWDERPEGWG